MIESRTTRRFWQLFRALPPQVQADAKRSFALFREDPWHPGFHFKKVDSENDIYSVRVGLGYRALGVMKKDRLIWYWIGGHGEYDRLI